MLYKERACICVLVKYYIIIALKMYVSLVRTMTLLYRVGTHLYEQRYLLNKVPNKNCMTLTRVLFSLLLSLRHAIYITRWLFDREMNITFRARPHRLDISFIYYSILCRLRSPTTKTTAPDIPHQSIYYYYPY